MKANANMAEIETPRGQTVRLAPAAAPTPTPTPTPETSALPPVHVGDERPDLLLVDDVAAFGRSNGDDDFPVNDKPMSVQRVQWEQIHHVLRENDGNVSATARALSMHRRTLQRKLAKHPARS